LLLLLFLLLLFCNRRKLIHRPVGRFAESEAVGGKMAGVSLHRWLRVAMTASITLRLAGADPPGSSSAEELTANGSGSDALADNLSKEIKLQDYTDGHYQGPYPYPGAGRYPGPYQPPAEKKKDHDPGGGRFCGPTICFSKDGGNCFENHPAKFCMKAVYTCVKYIIAGCKEEEEFAEQWEPREHWEPREEIAVADISSADSRDVQMPPLRLAIGAAVVSVLTGLAIFRSTRRPQEVESVDGAPFLP